MVCLLTALFCCVGQAAGQPHDSPLSKLLGIFIMATLCAAIWEVPGVYDNVFGHAFAWAFGA